VKKPDPVQRRRVTLEELEKRGFIVVRGSGRAVTFLGCEGMVAAMRRDAAKRKPRKPPAKEDK
jgi:hypothetical protein